MTIQEISVYGSEVKEYVFYGSDSSNDYKYNQEVFFGVPMEMRGELIIGPPNNWPTPGIDEDEEPEEYITDEDLEIDV